MEFDIFIPPENINFPFIFNLLKACAPEGLFFMKAKPCDPGESFFTNTKHPEILEEFNSSTLALLFIEGTPEEIDQVHQLVKQIHDQRYENSSKTQGQTN